MVNDILQTPIEFLKGVGPTRASILRSELGIKTFQDLGVGEIVINSIDRDGLMKGYDLELVSKINSIKSNLSVIDKDNNEMIIDLINTSLL